MRRTPIDVMLFDVLLPGVDRFAAFDLARAASPQTAIVLLSAYSHREDVERFVRGGAKGIPA